MKFLYCTYNDFIIDNKDQWEGDCYQYDSENGISATDTINI